MSISEYRARAREMLSGKWTKAVLVTLIAAILGGLVVGASANLNWNLDEETIRYIPGWFLSYLTVAAGVGSILGIAQFVIGGTVRLGYCKYLLKVHDGEEGEASDLFSEFDRFGDGFVLNLLTPIYIFLWSLLFFIPGIVATYRYAMAPFILQENPGMSARDAIKASKEMMDGRKGDLFFLNLSFFGWMLLNALTLGIGSLWLNPYMNAAYAAFYRECCPRIQAAVEPNVTVDF